MPISIPFLDHRKKGSSPLLNFQKDSIPSQRNSKTERELTRQSSADKNEGVANLMISSESEKTLVYQKFEKECQYWINVSSTATTKDEKEHAARIHTLFSDIKEDILTFQLLPPPQVILVLDRIERCLTQLKLEEFSNFDSWITHFTDLVLVYALMKTPSCSLLATTTSISRLCTLIEPSMTITERWLQTLQLNHPIHPHPAFFQFNERLSYINDLLACLLASSQAGATFDASELLAPMSTLNWNSEDVTWQTGMKQVDYLIQPCETFLAVTIKKTMEEDKHLLYRNWTKYMAIMKRLKIKNELSTERSVMRAQIQADLDMMERTLRDYSISACTLSDTVTDRMLWIHQSQARLRECDVMIQCIDVETNTYYVHHRHIQEELGRCRQQLLEEFHATAFQVRDQVLQQPHLISLHLSKGKLQVLYPDELGTLVHQVRQLLAFQCVLDPTLIKLAEEAQTQFKTAMVLRQLAHFYNTLESQVLPFHHAMLLPYVNQVEHCIKQPVHWKDPISVQRYLQNLYDATQEVQVQATTLQHAHHAIITVQLKMLQHPGESHWTSGLNEIQQLLNSHPWPSEALVPWKVHLQWQLYKISRHTYPTHLKKDTLPILHVDAIAKQGKVILRPPLEEVKRQYYRALLHHIFHPTRLPGLLQLPLGYTDIIETHAPDVIALYQQAHDMFETLEKKLLVYDEWVFLGAISKESLMDYVSKYTSKFEIDEWEGQFKVLKMKGKEAENLGTSFTVHHVTCSLFTLKAFIDEYLQRLFDALVQCLYKRIQDHAKVVQAFLDQGVQLVTITPRTFHELSLALEKHSQLQFTTIQQEWQQLQQKRTLFRSVTGTTPEMGDLVSRYQQVELMLKGHVLLLQDTRAQFDSQLDARIDQVQSHLHRLHEQWTHVSTSMSLDDFVSLVSDMENQLGNLKEECLYFGRTYPTMELFDNLRTMVHQACEAREVESQFYADVSPFLDALLGLVQIDALKNVLLPWKEKLNPQLTLNSTKTMLDVHKLLEGLWSIQAEWAMYFREVHAFGSQHWEELCQIVGITPSTHKMTLRMLVPNVSLLVSHADALAALNVRAKNEFVIREALQDIDMWSVACTFTLTKNTILNNNAGTSNSTVALLKDIKGIFSELGDQRASVTSLLHTPHAASFMELLTYWDQRLANLDQCLRHLWQVQRKWVYLGPVIQALPLHHQHTFTHVDLQFKTIMSKIDENPKVLHLLNQPNLLQQLPTMVQTLETCQKALLEFLELKRTSFPRFYFIGDDDLLEILSQSNTNPSVVQSHLKKLFSGIHQVLMDNTQSQVTHIVSVNGERVSLLHPITVSDQVDAWLSKLHLEIQSTLQTYLKQGIVQLNAYSTSKEPFASFFSSYPEQIRDLIFRIHMTRKIEDAIQTHNLQGLLNTLKEMSPRPSYDTLYYERVIQSLIEGNVTHLDAFSWTKTLRYYYDNDHCVIRIFDCSLDYTFEYQGNPSKLVQTPLTDTCFATLGQAMSEGLGGCLYGQAGTGKTESVKHLGYLLGRQVLVFNCDEGLDVNSMTRLFCGLVKCGAWGCFDEFNRLSSSVLAAISNLVATIQHALFHKSSSLVLSNTTIEVNPSACLFVTLNPVGKEYQGRQKLPDNLKQLFRNMAMTYPDIIYICQIELKTFGWKDADTLGRLVVDFFQACKHILSPQKHYDWGLRALKAVIWTAGDAHRSQPQMNETIVLIQSLKSNTESKLTKTDLHFFLILLEAYFKNTDLQVSHEDFNVALDVAYNELNLSPTLEQQRKSILQFQTALKQRMGVCLVGPPSSGKATLIKLLARVMQYLKKQVKVCWISPKSMPRTQLLGYLDPLTREWHDGVITLCARETLEAPDTFFFLVFW
ncbi:Cytoplasmic dynein 2 heavy chain 1 [Coelomomyces lativittatus]|nr:Cytoplasmic dynein 2 heavy chain 1 [Coelomomyces lativittatus]